MRILDLIHFDSNFKNLDFNILYNLLVCFTFYVVHFGYII